MGVYWGARQESREECARHLAAVLGALSEQALTRPQWLKKSTSRKLALREGLPIHSDGIAPLLQVNRRDVDSEVIRELGFSYSGWAPLEGDDCVDFSARIGSYCPAINNSFVLSIGTEMNPTALREILRIMVESLDPDSGRIGSSSGANDGRVTELYRYERKRSRWQMLRTVLGKAALK